LRLSKTKRKKRFFLSHLTPNLLKIPGAAMTLTKQFQLPFLETSDSQKSCQSTNFATASFTVNPATDSFPDKTFNKTTNNK
jgi:hypothetical protein